MREQGGSVETWEESNMITQIKEAHALVEEAKRIAGFPALLHRFLDTAAEAIVIVDHEGKIVLFNRRATFMFGWSSDEAIGRPVEILLPDSLQSIHADVHRKGFMAEPYTRAMGANRDLKAKHKNGTEFPVLIDLHPELGTDGVYVRAAIRRKEVAVAPEGVRSEIGKCPVPHLTENKTES
jgi:PAS domain S-box-containing protein